ncbi:MAG: hypothetical protein P8X89_23460 [Reinekea sp.]
MDRMNSNSYDHFHYYNQTYQGDGQHIFQPGTGQTSGGVAASGASWNHPGQSYQDFNVQEQIPFSPGPDWESALRTPQPMTMEDIIHSQIHQQDGQYSFQPETEQTFAEGPASGPWWSQPAPGQPQPYQNFNFPAQIPPLFESDMGLEYLQSAQSACQPMVLEDAAQNEAHLAPSNPQPAAAPSCGKAPTTELPPAKERFLAGLEAFARGVALKDCSLSLRFRNYIKDDGTIVNRGISLYDQFTEAEKTLLRQAISARQEIKSTKDSVDKRFLAGLDNYAQGVQLANCSATLKFKTYVTDSGYLHEDGHVLVNRLSPADRQRVNDALLSRRDFYSKRAEDKGSVEKHFLAGLDDYAQDAMLSACAKMICFSKYLTDDGKMNPEGHALYKRLSPQNRNRVNQALVARRRMAAQRIAGDLPYFMKALEPYSTGVDFQTCAKESGLTRKSELYPKVERYLTPEGGLTAKGELLIENLPLEEQLDVKTKVEQRRQLINPGAQVPESPWQLPEIPASMPEMGGMDPTAMVDPMQTEAMVDPMQMEAMVDPMQTEAIWASVWQMTGQAMPGIWGIPSESAEPSIPFYDNEAFGVDFQHDYGPYADQYPGRVV